MKIDLLESQRIPAGFFEYPLPITRVLYEAEQPIIYLTRTKQGQEMLAYLAGETEAHQYIVVAPAASSLVTDLLLGAVGVREALTSTWMWLVKEGVIDNSSEVWSIDESQIPSSHLPYPGTLLLPEHRAAITTRAIGDNFKLGQVPSSVVSYVADATRSALKSMLDYMMDSRAEGRPTDAQRALYDLPVQHFKFASFEIGFGPPAEDLFQNDVLKQSLNYLKTGLAWAEEVDSTVDLQVSDDVAEAILRATLALTPPTTGAITAIEIGGSWLNGSKYHLGRKSRSKISKRLRVLEQDELVIHTGRIGEIDDDKLSFTLRDVDGISERRAVFPEDLLDDMRTNYYESNRVEISGVLRRGKLRVTAIILKPEPS